jgi:hypothetical protein
MTLGRQTRAVTFVDTTDSAGIAIRYWLPAGATNLVIWSHPDSQTQQINPGYWAYPVIQAFLQEGYAVIASNLHDRSWGNAASQTDTVNAYNFMASRMAIAKVVMAGGSMGGMCSLLAIAKDLLPAGAIKGAVLFDGVTNLRNMYDAGTYTSVIETAHGITPGGADYATKTAGNDPNLYTAADYSGLRYRLYASSADTAVAKTGNSDAFATLVTSTATEVSVQSHPLGHLDPHGVWPADVIAFMKRCFA